MNDARVSTLPSAATTLLSVEHLRLSYRLSDGRRMRAVDDVSFVLRSGETLALVGESGCGKSSVAKAVMRLVRPEAGRVLLDGEDLASLPERTLRKLRRRFQMIFQDPVSSWNPHRRIGDALMAPLKLNGLYRRGDSEARVRSVLEQVGMDPDGVLRRYPRQFSGGQCQRLSIARALLLDPALLVCDEPVSALDVSVRAQVLNVLNALQRDLGLAMLFISHDLAVVRNVADRIAVMYLGTLCETGPAADVLERPAHPYTAALLSAVLEPDPDAPRQRIALQGDMPSPLAVPGGCRFRTRCPYTEAVCADSAPVLTPVPGRPEQRVACHFPLGTADRNAAAATIPIQAAVL